MQKKFTKIEEEFICDFCGKKVEKLGYTSRNQCHGDLKPISVELNAKKGYVIVFRCEKCGAIRKNKAAEDDNMDLLIDLSSKQYKKI